MSLIFDRDLRKRFSKMKGNRQHDVSIQLECSTDVVTAELSRGGSCRSLWPAALKSIVASVAFQLELNQSAIDFALISIDPLAWRSKEFASTLSTGASINQRNNGAWLQRTQRSGNTWIGMKSENEIPPPPATWTRTAEKGAIKTNMTANMAQTVKKASTEWRQKNGVIAVNSLYRNYFFFKFTCLTCQ